MSFIRPALAAAALAVPLLAAPLAAHAANTPVVVVDYGRVYKESAAGKYAQAQLKAIGDGINAELAPTAQSLQNDQASLGPKFQGKTPEQVNAALNADKDLAAKYSSFMQRLQGFLQKQNLRSQEMQATEQKALADVLGKAQPVVEEVMHAHGASVVMEKESTVANAPEVDITNDVLSRFNQTVTSVPVTKVDLTKPPAGR